VLLLAGAFAVLWPATLQSGPRHMNERNVFRNLNSYCAAQMAFRSGNEQKGYWRDDVAGLYALKGADGKSIKLIELSTAAADSRPVTKFEEALGNVKSMKAGYWYRTLRFPGETSLDPQRFAACAYPGMLHAGKWMYIVSEKNLCYRKEFLGSALRSSIRRIRRKRAGRRGLRRRSTRALL